MKQGDKLRAKYDGNLKRHWQWSVLLACSLIILDVILLWRDTRSGIIALIFTAVYFAAIILIYMFYRPRILREVIEFATGYAQVTRRILQEFEIPFALIDVEGRVLWLNNSMCAMTGRKRSYRKNISAIFPEINRGTIPVTGAERDVPVSFGGGEYRAHIQQISVTDLIDETGFIQKEREANDLYILYLHDDTQLNHAMQMLRDQRPVVALCYIDNYDEIMERTDEVRQSLLNVLAERRIVKYFSGADGLVKRLETDKYLVVMGRSGLDMLCSDHFSILESVRNINAGDDATLTISIGIGVDGKGYLENYEFAKGAMEMALGRGGDQAVVKDSQEMTFYGGKTQHGEKMTRVQSRMKAQAMRELIMSADNVVTMGHSMTDMDSFGASIGVYKAARTVGKSAHIVLGEINSNIRGWVSRFRESKDFDPGMFITHEQAMQMTDENTAVIVVDTNRSTRVECPQLLAQTKTVMVLDHHRQTADTITQAALSFIDTSASSACEMICEILQYYDETVKITGLEADCMYSGIVLDTSNFMSKTGTRTFEAAAYLRRCGADVTRVRKSLREDFRNYKARAEVVGSAENYMGVYAISICRAQDLDDPNVIGAQAANELLDIVGVKASFVVTEYEGKCFISARSIDEANVQLIMERLGGGGHLNMAGAQLSGVTPEEAVLRLKGLLKDMTEEGVI